MKMMILFMIMFFIYLLGMSYYLMSFLIMLEFMVITLLFFSLLNFNVEYMYMLYYMVLSVCEAIVGLTLMISMNFYWGHQKIDYMNLLC